VIDALIAGRLYGTASVRTAKVTGESLFVNVIAFAASAVEALLALTDGDSVALSGETHPEGLDRQARRSAAAPQRRRPDARNGL